LRSVHPIDDIAAKIRLVRLYRSQFQAEPRSIDRFTPARLWPGPPHEAIWTSEPAVGEKS